MKKISIVIPCYNSENYISICIDGFKKQLFDDVEFIFVNDGSTDHTLNYIKKFEREDDRVVVIDKPNEGVSKARNDALDVARGEYVYFLDPDDFIDASWCEEMYVLASKYHADILIFNFYNIVNGIKHFCLTNIPVGVYNLENILMFVDYLPITPKLYRREIIKNVRFNTNIKVGEVFDFFIGVLLNTHRIYVTDRFYYNYVRHIDSATKNLNMNVDLSIVDTLYSIDERVRKSECKIVTSKCFVYSVCKLLNGFVFNKYVKVVALGKARDLVDYVYTDSLVRKYIKERVRMTSWSSPAKYYFMLLYVSPKLLYFILRSCLRLKFIK